MDEEQRLYQLQNMVKHNCEDMHSYLKDLQSWETEIKDKEQILLNSSSQKVETQEVEDHFNVQYSEAIGKANIAKASGNRLVQKGNWKEAIESYTKAIEYHSVDPIFYANRALCYLKLEEMKLAESDCDKALKLDPTYVKAYMRRATARQALGNLNGAKEDFEFVIEKEPSNKFAISELSKIRNVMKKPAVEQTTISKMECVSPEINMKTDNTQSFRQTNILLPVQKLPHERSKVHLRRVEIIDTTTDHNYEKKRINTSNEIVPLRNEKIPHCISKFTIDKDVDFQEIPRTSVKFLETWNKIKHNPKACHLYLKNLNGHDFADIFKESLEVDTLSRIIDVLASEFVNVGDSVYNYIQGLTRVQRFSALILFLSPVDKKYLSKLIDYSIKRNECSTEQGLILREKYEL